MRVILGSVLVCAAALAACGGGGDESPQSPAGVWGFTNDPLLRAMINSAGEAIFYTSDGEIFRGTAQVSGSDLTIAVEGFADWGNTFGDGSTHGTGQLVGTVTTGGSLSATLTFTTDRGASMTASWELPYYSFYEISSLSDISSAGGYTGGFADPATLIFIDPSGVMSSQTALDGCVVSGLVSTADSAHNVYEVSYSYTGCTGAFQGLNGVQLTGLAFNSTNNVAGNAAPAQFTFVVTGASTAGKFGLLSTLVK